MHTESYDFKITKETEAKCDEAMKAATDLVANLKHEDLLLLANAAKTKPHLIESARPFLR